MRGSVLFAVIVTGLMSLLGCEPGERSFEEPLVLGGTQIAPDAKIEVLAAGFVFGLADVKPIPAIIVAQALNGVLLPFVAVFLLLCVNDRRLMTKEGLNGAPANAVLGAVVAVAVMLGVNNVAKALVNAFGLEPPGEGRLLFWSVCLAIAGALPVWRRARQLRRKLQI